MKRLPSSKILLFPLALLPFSLAAQTVQETAQEFQAVADLDGDGREDLLVLDRGSGGFRAAYQLSQGTWTWFPARASGIGAVAGIAAGKWFSTDEDALAVTSPLANRVHIVRIPVPGGLPVLHPVFPEGTGPDQLASPDIGGPGNTVHDDLWVATVENGSPDPHKIHSVRHDGSAFNGIASTVETRRPFQARTVRLKDGGYRHVVYLGLEAGQDDLLTIVSHATGSGIITATSAVPAGSRWVSGNIAGGGLHHFLAWRRGESAFLAIPVEEDAPDTFSLGSSGSFDTGIAIGSVHVVQSENGPRLLVIGESGEAAQVFSFDGTNPPALVQEITGPGNELISGCLPLAGGGFQLLSAAPGSGYSTTAVPYSPDGGSFLPGPPAGLPSFQAASLRANTFAFAGEPFVDPQAQLLGRYNAPDWTSAPVLQGGQLTVLAEVLGSPSEGLENPQAVVIGTVPMGTTFALANQYSEVVSLHSYAAGQGPTGASVEISPVDGVKTQAFLLSFVPSPANAPVHYRLNDAAWTQWNGQSLLVREDTTVHYFARDPITQQPSAIEVAVYAFEEEPHEIDSDGDGVPDFVEEQLGLDPLGGVDSDGDGYSDLNEIIVGTDPLSQELSPTPQQRLEENIAFRLRVAPRPLDGSSGTRSTAALGARLELYQLDGSSLGGGPAEDLAQPGVTGPGLALDAVVADNRQGFVTVMTEAIYAITTDDSDKDRGRELAGLFEIPEGELPTVEYVPGNGSQAEEAQAWIDAAILARNSAVRPLAAGNFTEIDTLVALVLEKQVESILLARAVPGLESGRLTLFGGRTGDTGRFIPTASDLADLRLRPSESLPAYDIRQLHEEIRSAVADDAGFAGLRDVATAIYALSSAFANAAEPGAYFPPFDVLRAFVRGASLPEPYLSQIGINQAALDAAQGLIDPLLAGLSARPVESFTLVVEEGSFSEACHGLTLLGTNQTVNLYAAPGQRWSSTDGFSLVPGTKLFVTGYTDLVEDNCDGPDMEVISVIVLSFPPPEATDADQDLLPDGWEETFLLGDGDPYADNDNDGINNLQELLDGTDPLDPLSKALEAADLGPPDITVSIDLNGTTLSWNFPTEYAGQIDWLVEVSDDFINWVPVPQVVVESPAGVFSLDIPASLGGFYRVQMQLK